jgi:hypothetical protein
VTYRENEEIYTIAGQPTGLIFLELLPKPPGVKMRLKGRFRCVCGKEWVTWIGDVRLGKTKSCGCWSKRRKNRTKARVGELIANDWFVMAINFNHPVRGWLYDVINIKTNQVRRNVTRRMIKREWEDWYRSLITSAWHSGTGKGRYDREAILGCTYAEFQDHVKRQFRPGMTVANYGQWHLDHIIPLCTATTAEECARLTHYTNIRPLWASENLASRYSRMSP